jgi:hypothetical protein
MRSDPYLRVVLTVIAAALLYLCIVLTPLPIASAQTPRIVGGRTPGEYTGPAEVVVVDWRLPDGASLPVNVTRGDVRVTSEVSVKGVVEVRQPPNNPLRTVLIGHEDGASNAIPGRFTGISQTSGRGVPVVTVQTRP